MEPTEGEGIVALLNDLLPSLINTLNKKVVILENDIGEVLDNDHVDRHKHVDLLELWANKEMVDTLADNVKVALEKLTLLSEKMTNFFEEPILQANSDQEENQQDHQATVMNSTFEEDPFQSGQHIEDIPSLTNQSFQPEESSFNIKEEEINGLSQLDESDLIVQDPGTPKRANFEEDSYQDFQELTPKEPKTFQGKIETQFFEEPALQANSDQEENRHDDQATVINSTYEEDQFQSDQHIEDIPSLTNQSLRPEESSFNIKEEEINGLSQLDKSDSITQDPGTPKRTNYEEDSNQDFQELTPKQPKTVQGNVETQLFEEPTLHAKSDQEENRHDDQATIMNSTFEEDPFQSNQHMEDIPLLPNQSFQPEESSFNIKEEEVNGLSQLVKSEPITEDPGTPKRINFEEDSSQNFQERTQKQLKTVQGNIETQFAGIEELSGEPKAPVKTYKLTEYAENYSSSNFCCSFCNKVFKSKWAKTLHIRRHTEEMPYKCTECGDKFRYPYQLKKHAEVEKHIQQQPPKSPNKMLCCKECDEKFHTYAELNSHKMTHSDAKRPFACSYCNKKFPESRIKAHKRTHTAEKPYACSFCDKRFLWVSQKKEHERIHTGEKPYSCRICEKRFAQIANIQSHERTHTGEQPFQCKFCDKKISNYTNLMRHERVHSGKQFSCQICGTQFRKISYRNAHKKNCKGKPSEESLSCTFCDKVFKSKTAMVCHIRTHTGEMPYKCRECGDMFRYSHQLKRHGMQEGHQVLVLNSTLEDNLQSDESFKDEPLTKGQSPKHDESSFNTKEEEFSYLPKLVKSEPITEGPLPSSTNPSLMSGESFNTKDEEIRCIPQLIESDPITEDPGTPERIDFGKDSSTGKGFQDQSLQQLDKAKEKNATQFSETEELTVEPNVSAKTNELIDAKNDSSANFCCSFCNKVLKSKAALIYHTRTHTGELPYICTECGDEFRHSYQLKKHAEVEKHFQAPPKSLEKKYNCKECDEKFITIAELKSHERTHSNAKKPFACSHCNKKLKTKWSLTLHKRMHTEEMTYICKVCGDGFLNSYQLKKHAKAENHIPEPKEKFYCKECNEKFFTFDELKSHAIIHPNDDRSFACSYCNKKYPESDIKAHERTHTAERPFGCSYCDKRFFNTSMKKIHERTHTGEKPHCCRICEKRFVTKGSLRVHERAHAGQELFKCKYCEKKISDYANLMKHENVHESILSGKKHSCKICGQKFQQKNYRNFHEENCRGVKREEIPTCTLCNKNFKSKLALKYHNRTHTGEVTYKCKDCGHGFRYSYQLKKHAELNKHSIHEIREVKSDKDWWGHHLVTLTS